MLTFEEKEFYKKNGYIKLNYIFTPEEVDELSDEYNEVFAEKQRQRQTIEAAWEGSDMEKAVNHAPISVLSIHNLQFHSAVFTRLLTNRRLMDTMEDIMETPNILLHHTKAHLKPPEKGAPYLMHQDYHYFPFKRHSMVAVFIHLDDTTPENGGLAVYPGSHLLGPQEDKGTEVNGEPYHYLDQGKFPLSGATPVPARRGEVVVFSYLLVHGSSLNTTDRPRRMFLIQLMSAEDEPAREAHRSPAQGMVLRGRNRNRDASMRSRFQH